MKAMERAVATQLLMEKDDTARKAKTSASLLKLVNN